METNIVIYSQAGCSACEAAKALCTAKKVPFRELILNTGQKQVEGKTYVPVQHLKDRLPNAKSVPQIFNGKYHIGGLEELRKWLSYEK